MILRISPDHRSRLLQWYDEEIFNASKVSAPARISALAQSGYGDVDDLIDQLNGAGVASVSPSSSAPPGLATVPSSPMSNAAVEGEPRTVPNADLSTDSEVPQPDRGKRGMRGRVRSGRSAKRK
jgi:hypothetical protein